MNHKTIFLRLAGLKIAKEMRDIRGKKFLQKQQKLGKIFEKFFIRQSEALIKSLENRANLTGVQIVEKSEWWDDILEMFEEDAIFRMSLDEILNEIYNLGIDTEFKERNAEVGGSFDITNIYSKNYAETRAGELMRAVSETTRNEVRSIFAEGWQNSNSLKQISEKIQEKFANFSSWRADLIAMQETSFAYEVGRSDQFAKLSRDTGITGWKRSQSQGDDIVRATHRQNELDGWIPKDEEFSGTGTMHAPHGFRCRCVVVRRLLEPQIDEKLGVYADVRVDLPNVTKEQLLKWLQTSYKKTPQLPKIIIEDDKKFFEKYWVPNTEYSAVTYGEDWKTKIVLWKDYVDNSIKRYADFSYSHRHENILQWAIIHEMWHATEIYADRSWKRKELDEIHNFLFENYSDLPLENIWNQKDVITKKRELFAEFYTLYIMGKEVPEEFKNFILSL